MGLIMWLKLNAQDYIHIYTHIHMYFFLGSFSCAEGQGFPFMQLKPLDIYVYLAFENFKIIFFLRQSGLLWYCLPVCTYEVHPASNIRVDLTSFSFHSRVSDCRPPASKKTSHFVVAGLYFGSMWLKIVTIIFGERLKYAYY